MEVNEVHQLIGY